jgi:hypothetical protein
VRRELARNSGADGALSTQARERGVVIMRKLLMTTAACLALGAPIARSQAPTEAPLPPVVNVNLNLEQRHTIKEFVKDLQLPKVADKFELTIGTMVPGSVALAPMPGAIAAKVPQVKSHRLFVTADRIVLVNPNDLRIAEVIEDTDRPPR